MNHPHLPTAQEIQEKKLTDHHRETPRELKLSTELTGVSFPALYLVRSSRLVRWLARVTFVSLLLGAVGLVFLPWQQSSRGQGRVVARDPQQRPQDVTATYDGVIEWIKPGFQEGSMVAAGDIVIRLAPFARAEQEAMKNVLAQAEIKRATAEATIEFSRKNVDFQRISGENLLRSVESELTAAQSKLDQDIAALRAAEADVPPKRQKYDSFVKLAPNYKSVQELAEAEAAWKAAEQKVLEAMQKKEESLQILRSKEQALASKRQDVEIKNAEADIKYQADVAKLSEAEKEVLNAQVKLGELERLEIIAPRSGTIQSLTINAGADTVKKGDVLFTVVPEATELAVELTVAGNDSPLVHVGDEVRLQFQGWPAIQWVGWPSVAVGTFGGRVNSINPSDNGMGDFIVFVTPDTTDTTQVPWPDNRYLRQGVRANGWVLLKTVPLGYEIWRQLNGFPPIIDPPKGMEGKDKKSDDPKKPKLPKL